MAMHHGPQDLCSSHFNCLAGKLMLADPEQTLSLSALNAAAVTPLASAVHKAAVSQAGRPLGAHCCLVHLPNL